MSEFQYKAGLSHVGSYQISGVPYVTASLAVPGTSGTPLEIVFPSVTQMIRIHNHATTDALRVGFSANGVKGSNYWLVDAEDSNGKGNPYCELRVKTDRIYLLSNSTSALTGAYISAELTAIQINFNLAAAYSGSNGIG